MCGERFGQWNPHSQTAVELLAFDLSHKFCPSTFSPSSVSLCVAVVSSVVLLSFTLCGYCFFSGSPQFHSVWLYCFFCGSPQFHSVWLYCFFCGSPQFHSVWLLFLLWFSSVSLCVAIVSSVVLLSCSLCGYCFFCGSPQLQSVWLLFLLWFYLRFSGFTLSLQLSPRSAAGEELARW